MTELFRINVLAQKWHLAYFVTIDGYFGQLFGDMNFKFVLPFIYINLDIQTRLKSIRPKLAIIFSSVIHLKTYSSYICQ